MRIKADPVAAGVSIRFALNLALVFAALAQPFIPDATAKIAKAFINNDEPFPWPSRLADKLAQLTAGAPIGVPDVLFAKIEDEQITKWTERFGGADK
jgi:methionyl-tRNA synthetase